MRHKALFKTTLGSLLACLVSPAPLAHATAPVIWSFQPPQGTATSDSRITKMVRLPAPVYTSQSGKDAGALAASIAGTVPSGRVCIMLQNFGDSPGYCDMSHNSGDALVDPVYSLISPFPQLNGANTLWTFDGRAETLGWMEEFIKEYRKTGPTPNRFHFDNEAVLSSCCSSDWVRLFEAMQSDSGHTPNRYNTEVMPGFGSDTLADMYDDSRAWLGLSPGQVGFNSAEWMGSTTNLPFARWINGVALQILDGAMDEAAYTPIKTEWASCLTSNYLTSCRIDGASSRFYTSEYSSGVSLLATGVHWEGSGDLQAPYFYSVDAAHISGGESLWDAAMRVHTSNLDAMIHSYGGGHQSEITPWVSVVNQKFNIGGTTYNVTEADTRRMLALLRSREIGEFIAFNNDLGGPAEYDCNDPLSWSWFQKVVDGIWGATISGASVVTGSTAQSPQAPVTSALGDPLNVTAAMIGAGDYRATVEVTYSSAFATAPCKLAAVLEGTASGASAVNTAVEFYNFSTTGWDSAATDPGYLGVPNQKWRVISATDHIDPTGTRDIKVRVKYTSTASFTVALDCVQAIAFAAERLSGDANGDGVCNTADYTIVLGNYSETVCKWTNGDLNGDGVVNTSDLTLVLGSCTTACP